MLNPQVVEERTQAIGRELFAAARREHAHLSALNHWTAQVLSWCLSDPSTKANVLRFIDVLPSLTRAADVARHVREYFPTTNERLPVALRLGARLAAPGLLTQGALAAVIRQSVEHIARQFIAESHAEGAAHVIRTLAARQATCSLDILGEQILSEAEADAYAQQCHALLAQATATYAALATSPRSCGPQANLSVKPSALTPRFDPISPAQSIERAFIRLRPLLDAASEQAALINLDMEQYELRDLTLDLAKRLLLHETHVTHRSLGVVIQAYLRDAEQTTTALLSWLAAHERVLTVRLVKGAYWDYEMAQAAQCHWLPPVYDEKAQTDLAFERLTEVLLGAAPLVTTAIASHNIRSIAHAMAVAEALRLEQEHLEFQLLYGMGDAIHAAIVARGYPVRIYTPIGALIPGMAYLVRRILENTSNESFLRQEFLSERSAEELLAAPHPTSRAPGATPDPSPAVAAWRREPLRDFSDSRQREDTLGALAHVRATLGQRYPVLIGEESMQTREMLTGRNPARPDEIIGHVGRAGRAEADRAVECATRAQRDWARTPVRERVACLRRAAELLRARRPALTAWTVLEVGKTWREADVEIVEAIEYLEYYGEQMLALSRGKPVMQLPGESNHYLYQPRGVAVVIAPWNFPAAILMGMTSAALVTGNAAIVKPAEQSSVLAAHLVQALREAGVPPGIIQYLPGIGEEVGAALVRHPGTHAVVFTGSKSVGLSLIQVCATLVPGQRFVKHIVTEMGGKNAIVVDADADADAAVQGVLRSAFGYAGQKCSAASRLIVHEAVYERVLPRLIAAADRLVVGDPADPGTDVGPLIDERAQRRLHEAIAHAKDAGTLAYQYPVSRLPTAGYYVSPTIATDIDAQDRLATDELFGPLLCVFRVKSFEDGLAMANATDYALTGGVYSRSPSHIEQAIRTFDVGNLYVNRPITGAMVGRQPFGGHRLSGLGTKAGGPDYLLQLLIPKTICTNTARHGMPLE